MRVNDWSEEEGKKKNERGTTFFLYEKYTSARWKKLFSALLCPSPLTLSLWISCVRRASVAANKEKKRNSKVGGESCNKGGK